MRAIEPAENVLKLKRAGYGSSAIKIILHSRKVGAQIFGDRF